MEVYKVNCIFEKNRLMFEKISPEKLDKNAIQLLSKEWMLITAGKLENFNNMTASWGGFGYLWNKPVSFIFIRPPRYTYQFVEANPFFTLCFFNEKYKDMLNLSGTKSGREIDKMHGLGLTPMRSPNDSVYYKEASIVMECRKSYCTDIEPTHFIDENIIKNYPKLDFHRMYIGEITETKINKESIKNTL